MFLPTSPSGSKWAHGPRCQEVKLRGGAKPEAGISTERVPFSHLQFTAMSPFSLGLWCPSSHSHQLMLLVTDGWTDQLYSHLQHYLVGGEGRLKHEALDNGTEGREATLSGFSSSWSSSQSRNKHKKSAAHPPVEVKDQQDKCQSQLHHEVLPAGNQSPHHTLHRAPRAQADAAITGKRAGGGQVVVTELALWQVCFWT